MTPSVAPVLVAGGGPSGLVAALALLHNQIPVRIIEKESCYRAGQRAPGIWPRTFELFHLLRVHEMNERSTPLIPSREYKRGTLEPSKTFTIFPYNDPAPSIPYSNPKFLGQPLIEGILRSHLETYGCHVELGTELQSFEDDGYRVLAKLVKRKDGEEISEIFEASYLIGADGARGVTRKQLGLSFLGETKEDFTGVVGDICLEVDGIDREHWHFFGDRSSEFLMLRPTNEIAPDGFQCLMSVKRFDPKELIANEKLMLKFVSEMIGHDVSVREVVCLAEFRPNIRMVDKFGIGRVFVTGDAAHPTGGQGLNTSVQDALNLVWKLSLAYKNLSPVALLDSYTIERLPVVAEMLNITTGMLHNMLDASTFERAMTHEKRLDMLGVNYRMSPIVVEEFTQAEPVSPYGVLEEGVLVAGDRAPDAPGLVVAASVSNTGTGTETRLFDVFSPTYHTVLVFAPDVASSTDVLEALREYPVDVIRLVIVLAQSSEVAAASHAEVVVDRDGHAYQAYLVTMGEKKVVVVRPDGVVGALVRSAEGMETYFSKILVKASNC